MKLPLDSNGIPVVSRHDIESHAEDFLKYFAPNCLSSPQHTPLSQILTELIRKQHLIVRFDLELGRDEFNRIILGQFNISKKAIYISPDILYDDPRYAFTVAHELGHFVYHRNLSLANIPGTITDSISDIRLERFDTDNPKSIVEWQANKFASSLLLPKSTMGKAVIVAQVQVGISRNLGKITVTNEEYSKRDYNLVLGQLRLLYQVSKAAIRIRLLELNILEELNTFGGRGPQTIAQALGSGDLF